MNDDYIEYNFRVRPKDPAVEILIAELSRVKFDGFLETESGINAYILGKNEDKQQVERLSILRNPDFTLLYKRKEIPSKNWNEEWEKNFIPIEVDKKCYIRAGFHDSRPEFEYEVVIDPKMSFGTGHHETTHLMVQQILNHNISGKTVLDIGCGTAILAILAKMKGASYVRALDVDPRAFENALENAKKNNQMIDIKFGGANLLTNETFDVIFANINRNVLLEDAERYVKTLNKGGNLFLSGFYRDDLPLIRKNFEKYNAIFINSLERNEWSLAQFKKDIK